MSDTGQNRFEIDLDEIERQLRRSAELGPAPSAPQADPLAELARIVGQDDPFLNILGETRRPGPAPARERQEPTFGSVEREDASAPVRPAPRSQADAALTAEDRSVLGTEPSEPEDEQPKDKAEPFDPVARSYGEAGPLGGDDFMPMAAPPARRRVGAVMALVALTAVGAGGAFTWRKMSAGSTPSGPPPLIKADNAPLKVAPENPGGMDIPNQDRQIYEGKVESGRSRVLDRQEQPIDVKEAARQMPPVEPPAPVAAPAAPVVAAPAPTIAQPAPAAEPQLNGQIATANPRVPAPPPSAAAPALPSDTAAQTAPAPQRSAALSALGEPRRVRTVAVRPDGTAIGAAGGLMVSDPNATILPSGQLPPPVTRPSVSIPLNGAAAPQPQAQPAPAPAAAAAAPTALPATPAPSATPSTDGSTPATTATPVRILPPQRPRNLSATAAAANPPAEPVTTAAAAAPAQSGGSLFPFNFGGSSEPARSPAPEQPAAGARTYAVQLAVRPSEAAARTAYDQIADKFPTELGGKPATVTEAQVNGRSVFRIRVTPLTRQDANDLCTRLKASGGQCFVVAN